MLNFRSVTIIIAWKRLIVTLFWKEGGRFPVRSRVPPADFTEPRERCDVAHQRRAARADAAVARALRADGGEERRGKQARRWMRGGFGVSTSSN